MSLKLRLARAGTKKRPYYHIVLADARSPHKDQPEALLAAAAAFIRRHAAA